MYKNTNKTNKTADSSYESPNPSRKRMINELETPGVPSVSSGSPTTTSTITPPGALVSQNTRNITFQRRITRSFQQMLDEQRGVAGPQVNGSGLTNPTTRDEDMADEKAILENFNAFEAFYKNRKQETIGGLQK